jgi:MoaA/NifB/PqqE/SkfB family radical SAM enzyme
VHIDDRHTLDTYGFRPGAEGFPLMVVLVLSYRCNAACNHCPYTHTDIRDKYADALFMAPDLFRKIATEVGAHGAFLRVSGGGEPMLHPDAVDLLLFAKRAGCRVGLITNGSAFTDESSRAILDAGVDMIEFSVDAADAPTYARVRAGLNWDRLVRNVSRMIALRDSLRSSSKVIASGIIQQGVEIDRVETFWRRIGVDGFIQRKFLTWGWLDRSMSADQRGFIDPQTTPCPYPFERLGIDAKGNVMLCIHDLRVEYAGGNVRDMSIKGIWLGEAMRDFREKHLALRGRDVPLCADCPDWQYRTWTHPYYRVAEESEAVRRRRLGLAAPRIP